MYPNVPRGGDAVLLRPKTDPVGDGRGSSAIVAIPPRGSGGVGGIGGGVGAIGGGVDAGSGEATRTGFSFKELFVSI